MDKFRDRWEAGIVLAKSLKDYANLANVIILALPRGGLPVAYEIAQALSAPLDIFIVRKLGVPEHAELAMGAIASHETVIFNTQLLNELKIEQASIDAVLELEQKELWRRERLYRGDRPFPKLEGKTIVLVDDGIATGATMQAAVVSLRKHNPASIIIAVPVAARETCGEMTKLVDRMICPLQPLNFYAVGLWYENFTQISDLEVIEILEKQT
ncbi:MAG: phosphoribosyltransferase [Tatlockia sp.]|nr:phosphoribosyltransferase [Tatlockia sp.]